MIDNDLAAEAERKGQLFAERFAAKTSAAVRDVRQLGLMIGIELKERAQPFIVKLMEHGILALPAGPTVLRLLPPLVVTDRDIETVVDTLHEVLEAE